MSTQSGISIMVDGVSTDLADVTWLEVAPCGCGSGCTVAYLAQHNIVNVTADQAANDYYETKAGREQAERRGFTIIPIRRGRLVDLMALDCQHIPKWGYERPIPAGMGWAASKWGRGRVLHLVDSSAIDTAGKSSDAKPLCKAPASYGWSHKFREGQPDCESCIKVALAQGALL